MKGPGSVRRNRIAVPARLRRRTPLRLAVAAQINSVEITLSRVFRRGYEVKRITLFVQAFDTHHVERTRRDQFRLAAIARYQVNMTPPIAFTHPKKSFAVCQPVELIH